MTTLFLTLRPLQNWSHGYDLRVAHLAEQTPGRKHLFVIPLSNGEGLRQTIDLAGIFESCAESERPPGDGGLFNRHFRTSDSTYYRSAFPAYASRVSRQLEAAAKRWGATSLAVFGGPLAEFCCDLPFRQTLMDVCDSASLTARRQLNHVPGALMAKRRLELFRTARAEGALPMQFSIVTTINEADSNEVRRLSGGAENVRTVPNGTVLPIQRIFTPPERRKRGVVFWGNLDFAPNSSAVRFFLDSVYEPFLRQSGAEVCIIGRNAEPWLQDRAKADPQVRLLGYVESLADAVTEYRIMVNPMVIGSGMKNKLLEAFALGVPVVSTSLGAESIEGVVDGKHLRICDDPRVIAETVMQLLDQPQQLVAMMGHAQELVRTRYTWDAVGRVWRQALNEAAERVSASML